VRPIRASEIGAYLYCQRAWWYRLQGIEPGNSEELAAGQALHYRHGRQVFIATLLRVLAVICLLAALVLLTAYFTHLWLS